MCKATTDLKKPVTHPFKAIATTVLLHFKQFWISRIIPLTAHGMFSCNHISLPSDCARRLIQKAGLQGFQFSCTCLPVPATPTSTRLRTSNRGVNIWQMSQLQPTGISCLPEKEGYSLRSC